DDSLEPNAAGWQIYNSSVRSNTQVWSDAASARSPKTSGFMIMFGGPTDWSSFGRPVNISVVYPGATQKTCAARIYISPYQGLRPQKPTIHGSLDVIDGDTWTYLASQPFSLVPSTNTVAVGPYLPITTTAFIPPRPNIFVRVVL